MILASKCPGGSWDTFAEVMYEVSTFFESCSRKEEISLMTDVVTEHRWPKAEKDLRISFEKDSSHIHQPLNWAFHPVAAGKVMMRWLWFWQAVAAARAR